MNKLVGKLLAGLLAGLMLIGVSFNTGCDLSTSQIKALFNTAGVATAYAWLYEENPTDAQKVEVTEVLGAVQTSISQVGTNSYVDVVYPQVQQYVAASTSIPAQDKPLILLGSLTVLSGIDIAFATHPEWKADVDNAGTYVAAFISGANSVLLTPCTDKACLEASKHYKLRMRLRNK